MATEHTPALEQFLRKLGQGDLGSDVLGELSNLSGNELEELAEVLAEREEE